MTGRGAPPDLEQTESTKPKGFDDFELRLGDVMRGERATMGKSLLDVQRDLKIKATYIAAIENADPTAFDTPGFVAGYVRSYARYLNLDPEWAFESFCNEGGFENPQGLSSAPRAVKKKTERSSSAGPRDPFTEPSAPFIPTGEAVLAKIEPSGVISIAILMVLLGGIGYGGWSVLQEVQKVRFTPVDQAPGVLSELDPLQQEVVAAESAATDVDAFEPPTAEAFDRLYRPPALDTPVLIARDAPISTLDPDRVGILRPEVGTPPDIVARSIPIPQALESDDFEEVAQAVQVVAPDVPEIALFAVRPSWVRVRAADGTIIFEKILDAGERFVLPQTELPPVLRAGNAGSLYFSVNGDMFGPAGSGASVVRDVVLATGDIADNYTLADLTQDADLARFVAVAEAQTGEPAAE